MAKNPPTVRMRRLGAQLRKIREDRGLTLDDAANLLKLSKSALNRMENAQVVVRPYETEYLLLKYEVADTDLRASLLGLASAGRSKEWVKRNGALAPGPRVGDLVQLEQDSSTIRICQPFGIPGLLQTPDYAHAVMSSVSFVPAQQVTRAVAFRMARKEALTRAVAVRLDAVMGEAALRQQMGGTDVMRSQLQHLLEASAAANVTVRVLPFEATKHPGFDGPFTMLDVETGNFTVVVIDSLARSVYLEDDADVERYNVVFAELCATALSELETRTMIERILHELDSGLEKEQNDRLA